MALSTVAIVQARMGSSRLPGKVLYDIAGTSMIERVLQRVAAAKLVDKVVVATTISPEDEILANYLRRETAWEVFRGSEEDVLTRYHECARMSKAEIVVRVTADDPLKDPQIIDKAIHNILSNQNIDYCSNTIEPTYPEGLDIEVFKFSALDKAYVEARLPSEREHVTPYIWKHPKIFNLLSIKSMEDLNHWRWTVDHTADVEFMSQIYSRFNNEPLVPYQKVVDWLKANPNIRKINASGIRNEGYLLSLERERNGQN